MKENNIIKTILNNFIDICSKKLKLRCIMQFGSSTYSDEFKDIDLVFFSNKTIFPTEDYVRLFNIINNFESNYKEIAFNIAGGQRKRKSKYSISIIPLQNLDLNWKIDSFFLKNLAEDKNKKILFGIDPTNIEINLSNKQLAERLSLEINHHLRNCLEKESKKEAIYSLFKTTLRLMLVNEGTPEKQQLLKLFNKRYKQILLPVNAEQILNQNIKEKDSEAVFKFSEDSLNYLYKMEAETNVKK